MSPRVEDCNDSDDLADMGVEVISIPGDPFFKPIIVRAHERNPAGTGDLKSDGQTGADAHPIPGRDERLGVPTSGPLSRLQIERLRRIETAGVALNNAVRRVSNGQTWALLTDVSLAFDEACKSDSQSDG